MNEKPTWTIEGKSDLHGIGKSVACDRCGSNLWAEVWYVKDSGGKVHNVGSGCVKTLTGRTVSQLQRDNAEYMAACAEDEAHRHKARLFADWSEVNAAELSFIDEHLTRIHEAQDKYYASNPGIGAGAPPSAEFYERLRMKTQALGMLTENELAAIRREMSLDHSKELPATKTKGVYCGTVERVFCEEDPYSRTGGWKAKITLRADSGDLLYFLQATQGTQLAEQLLKKAGFDASAWILSSKDRRRLAISEALRGLGKLTFQGTVKGSAATGGKIYFTRANLINESMSHLNDSKNILSSKGA